MLLSLPNKTESEATSGGMARQRMPETLVYGNGVRNCFRVDVREDRNPWAAPALCVLPYYVIR